MEQLINILQSSTPVGVIALCLIIILQLVKNKKEVKDLKENHMSCFPEMIESLKRIESKLETINDNTTFIKAKINGRKY